MAIDLTKYQEAGTLPIGEKLYLDPATGLNTRQSVLEQQAITPQSLTPTTPINVPHVPISTPVDTTGTQAIIDDLNKQLAGDTSKDTADFFTKYFGSAQASASLASSYQDALKTGGIYEKEQDVLTQQTTAKAAKSRLAAINAQLAGITVEAQAAPIRLQEESKGRGVTTGGLAPLEAGELRKIALRALPLQAEALAAQAQVASAQGDVELSQRTLEIAQNRINTLFGIVTKDVENTYNYWKDLRNKAFDVASDVQKTKLATQQKEDDRKFANWQNIINDAQSKASALMSTQPDLAAKISARVGQSTGINDTTLGGDVATLMGQVKQTGTGDIADFKSFFPNVDITTPTGQQQFLNWKAKEAAAGRKGEDTEGLTPVDLVAYAQQWASTGKIPTGLPKGSFGAVSQFAKEMPKQEGTIIDVNTGVKPDISEARIDGLAALYDISKKTEDLKQLQKERIGGIVAGVTGKIFGSAAQQRYIDLRTEIIDLLARARTGAALTVPEEKFYTDQLPGRFTEAFFLGPKAQNRLDNFATKINRALDTKLKANGASIVGFSTIKLGGKDYKVGDIIEVNGVKGRILADGSIALIQ